MAKRICKNCKYCEEMNEMLDIDPEGDWEGVGRCRRYPPKGEIMDTVNKYPQVHMKEDWCGEFYIR